MILETQFTTRLNIIISNAIRTLVMEIIVLYLHSKKDTKGKAKLLVKMKNYCWCQFC
jgi:hypothetical protein